MPVDYSKIPTDDLMALREGNLEGVSTETLKMLSATDAPSATGTKPKQPEAPEWAGKYPSLYGAVGATRELTALGAEGAALTGGAIAGAPVFPPFGSVIGAGLAYGATKLTQRALEGEKASLGEEAKKTAIDVGLGASIGPVSELPLKIASGTIQKIAAPLAKKIEAETAEYIKTAEKMGYTPTPAETMGEHSKALSMLEGILTYLPTSASMMYKARINNLQKLVELRSRLVQQGAPEKSIEAVGFRVKREAQKVLDRITSRQTGLRKEHIDALQNEFLNDINAIHSPDARVQGLADALMTFRHSTNTVLSKSGEGKTVQDMLGQVKDRLFKSAGQKLDDTKIIMKDSEVPLMASREKADQLLAEEMQSSVPDAAVIRWLRSFSTPKNALVDEWLANPAMQRGKNKEALDALLSAVPEQPKTWTGLDLDVQKLLKHARDANALQGTAYAGTRGSMTSAGRSYSELASAVKEDMAALAKSKNPEAHKLFIEGKDEWRRAKELFDDDVLGIMKSSPEDVFRKIINPGEVTRVREAKVLLGDEGFQPFRELFSKEVVALDKKGLLDVAKTKTNINRYGETVQEVLGVDGKQRLLKMVASAEKVEANYARTEVLSGVVSVGKDGVLDTNATKKALLKNKEKLTEHYTEAELLKFESVLDATGKIEMKHLARTKHDAVEFLNSLVGTDNTGVVNAIVRPGNTINIRYMQKLLGPERSQEVATKFIENYLMKINEHGFYLPGKAAKVFNNYDAAMKKLFDPRTYREIQGIMQLNRHAERLERLAANPSQTGQTLIMFQTGKEVLKSASYLLLASMGTGAAVGGAGGAAVGVMTTAGLMGAPYLLAKLYLSPIGRKYLTTGFTVPAVSPEGMKLMTQMAQLVGIRSREQKTKEAPNE